MRTSVEIGLDWSEWHRIESNPIEMNQVVYIAQSFTIQKRERNIWWHEKHDVRKTRAIGAKIPTEKKETNAIQIYRRLTEFNKESLN